MTLCDHFQAVHHVFEKAKCQFNLPPIGIDQDVLKCTEIEPIGDEFVAACANRQLNQPKLDALGVFMQ